MNKKKPNKKTKDLNDSPISNNEWDEFIEASSEVDEDLGNTVSQMVDEFAQLEGCKKQQKKSKRFSFKRLKERCTAKYKYYAIISPSNEVISILYKKDNVSQVLMKVAYQKYKTHFLLWREHHGYTNSKEELKNLTKTLPYDNSWKEYFSLQSQEILNYLSTYTVKELFYSKESVATILRMFNHCVPFNTDEESEFERLYYEYEEQLSKVMREDMDGDDLWEEEKKKNKNVA